MKICDIFVSLFSQSNDALLKYSHSSADSVLNDIKIL